MMNDPLIDELIAEAIDARQRAYAPYSQFQVGAALRTDSGEVFSGCNVENASYGLAICAERVAASTAVAAGYRRFSAVVVASSGGATPCGACRQFLAEFGNDLAILIVDVDSNQVRRFVLSELLPNAFGFDAQ